MIGFFKEIMVIGFSVTFLQLVMYATILTRMKIIVLDYGIGHLTHNQNISDITKTTSLLIFIHPFPLKQGEKVVM